MHACIGSFVGVFVINDGSQPPLAGSWHQKTTWKFNDYNYV